MTVALPGADHRGSSPGYRERIHDKYNNTMTLMTAGMCTRPSEPRLRRDVAASETLAEMLKLPRLSEASTSRQDFFRDIW